MAYKIPARRGDLDLFEFDVQDDRKQLAAAFRAHGMPINANQINRISEVTIQEILEEWAEAASEEAFKKIPYDTEELKNSITKRPNPNHAGSIVYVPGGDHYGSSRDQPEDAGALARYLDEPDRPLRRTNGTRRGRFDFDYEQGSPTNDWIKDAQIEFQGRAKLILSEIVRKYS